MSVLWWILNQNRFTRWLLYPGNSPSEFVTVFAYYILITLSGKCKWWRDLPVFEICKAWKRIRAGFSTDGKMCSERQKYSSGLSVSPSLAPVSKWWQRLFHEWSKVDNMGTSVTYRSSLEFWEVLDHPWRKAT